MATKSKITTWVTSCGAIIATAGVIGVVYSAMNKVSQVDAANKVLKNEFDTGQKQQDQAIQSNSDLSTRIDTKIDRVATKTDEISGKIDILIQLQRGHIVYHDPIDDIQNKADNLVRLSQKVDERLPE